MFFSFLALMVGILGGIMLLVVIFSLLTMAKRADAQAEKLFGMGWEEGRGKTVKPWWKKFRPTRSLLKRW